MGVTESNPEELKKPIRKRQNHLHRRHHRTAWKAQPTNHKTNKRINSIIFFEWLFAKQNLREMGGDFSGKQRKIEQKEDHGVDVVRGLYFYKLKAGEFSSAKKIDAEIAKNAYPILFERSLLILRIGGLLFFTIDVATQQEGDGPLIKR